MGYKVNQWLGLILIGVLGGIGLILPHISLSLDDQWVEIGAGSASGTGISITPADAVRPDIATGPDGTLVLAWSDMSGDNTEIYAKQWRDGSWQEIGNGSATGGGISNNTGSSESPSVAVGSNGVIYVAWEDSSGGNKEIYVRRFINGAWYEIEGSASKGGISDTGSESRAPSLYLGPEDLPYVVWEEAGPDDSEIYVRRWNANAWVEVGPSGASDGGISDNSGDSTLPSVVVNNDGDVIVAWADKSGGDTEIYARYFAGSAWAEIGAGSASGGGISNNSGTSRSADLALADDGTVYVAWADDSSGNYEIYARRWDGAWDELGTGSATGGGISQNTRHSHAPRIAIDAAGQPAVGWYQATAADAEIYLRRWNGSIWEELGGSGSGNGLSDNSGASSHPVLAAFGQGLAVAWNDNSSGMYAIYARQWMESDEPTPTVTTTTIGWTVTPTSTSTPATTATATFNATTTATATPTSTVTVTTAGPTATMTATATSTNAPTAASTATVTTSPTGTPAPHYLPVALYQLLPSPTPTNTPTVTTTPIMTSTPTVTPTPTATVQPIDELQNGDFEQGRNGAWTELSEKGLVIITNQRPTSLPAHSGVWISWLGGVLNDNRAIRQQVTVPQDRPFLRYWHWIASADACGYDVAGVVLDDIGDDDDVVDGFWLCDDNDTNGWRMRLIDLRAYSGRSLGLLFLSGTDGTLNSNWFIDDIAFVSTSNRETPLEVERDAAERLEMLLTQISGRLE